ncbi:sensor histidine kinase [Rhodocaloribacter sp.]
MIELLFAPSSVPFLTLCILSLTVFGYLLSVRAKSDATWWLAVAFSGLSLCTLYGFLAASLFIFPDSQWLDSGQLFMIGAGLFFWSYLQFAYRFLVNPFPREATGVLGVTSALLLAGLGATAFRTSALTFSLLLYLGFFLWTTAVLLRKWWHSARQPPSERSAQTRRAFRAFALINMSLLVYAVLGLAGMGGSPLFGAAGFGFFFGIVVVYLNYAPEPTSFQVKLIGLSLVTVLALLTAAVYVLNGFAIKDFAADVPPRQALRFIPSAAGGYVATALPYHYESNLGEDLHLGDDAVEPKALGFPFPFFGKRYDRLFVGANGLVTFGAPIHRGGRARYRSEDFFNDLAKIAPLYLDLDPSAGGGVFFRQLPDRVVITWHEVPLRITKARNSVQLVLHRSGIIDVVYDRVDAVLVEGMRGLMPGPPPFSSASPARDLPYRIPAGSARIENFEWDFRRRAHREVWPLIGLVLGATLLVLGLFPFIFRSSLVKPLERLIDGVQRVNAGDLTAGVPVGVHDEIGRLTQHFNRMTQSLRRYNGEMEALVGERTVQLEQSLEDLKATQAQLIQAEKMASLGQLTAGIAHEIKNPLNFINNFAEINGELVEEMRDALDGGHLAEARDLLGDLKANADLIATHGKRADGIVQSMMAHAHGGTGERETVDVNTFVDEYVGLAYHGKQARNPGFTVEIATDYGEAGILEVAPQEMGRVLVNLLSNAFDAVHEHAQSQNGAYAPKVTVTTRRESDHVAIRVADNGPGIPEAVREKIFEPFFTTKPAGSGTGLGLSLSYDIVTQGHGGMLTVESAPGQGAAFVVTVPVDA